MAEVEVEYKEINGFKFGASFTEENVMSCLNYKPKDGDLFIATYPRSGTNWTHQLVYLIHHEGEPPRNLVEYHKSSTSIDMLGTEPIETAPKPTVIATHLPFQLVPYSSSAKYINVVRNPKDCFTSLYHFFDSYKFNGTKEHVDVNKYFNDFIIGNTPYESYFDHVMSWYSHRNDPNVLFITYEEMKKDIRAAVLKMAAFMGEEYKNMVSDDAVMDKIVLNSTVKSVGKMFDVTNLKPEDGNLAENYKEALATIKFIRKGVVGDWHNLLSKQQTEKMNEISKEKFKGTDLLDIWKEQLN